MRIFLFPAALLLAGCVDQYQWRGTWNAEQVNLANIAAQTADWRDLDHGHGDPGSDGQEAAAAVARLRNGTVKPIATVDVSQGVPSIAAPAAAPAAAAPAAAAAAN